jgi:hypothetical protein
LVIGTPPSHYLWIAHAVLKDLATRQRAGWRRIANVVIDNGPRRSPG